MPLRIELQRVVLQVMNAHIGIGNFSDEDFAFVAMCEQYGARRDSDASNFGEREVVMRWGDTLKTSTAAKEPPRTAVDPVPTKELDRGPEPQTLAETLDTAAPKPASTFADTLSRDVSAADLESAREAPNPPGAPDYETLITKKPE